MVKLGFIAAVLLFISCSSGFPLAPEMEFCKFELDNETKCESVHIFPKSDCDAIGGEIVNTCKEPKPETETD